MSENELKEWKARVDDELRELRARLKVVEVQHEVTEASLRRHWLEVLVQLSEERDASAVRAQDVSSLRRESGDRFVQVQTQLDELRKGHLELHRVAALAMRVGRVLRRRVRALSVRRRSDG